MKINKTVLLLFFILVLGIIGVSGDWDRPIKAKPYAHMTNDNNTLVNVISSNTWYEVQSGFIENLNKYMTFGGNHYYKVQKSGTYLVEVSGALLTGAAGQNIGLTVGINGNATYPGHAHSTTSSATDAEGMSTSLMFNLNQGDEISMFVINHGSTNDVTIVHASITITSID